MTVYLSYNEAMLTCLFAYSQVVHKGVGISTRPTPQCIVKVRSKGHLDSGDVVDKHSSCVFTVGDGDVIQG